MPMIRYLCALTGMLVVAELTLWLVGFPDWWRQGALVRRPSYVVLAGDGTWEMQPGRHTLLDSVSGRSITVSIESGGNRSTGVQDFNGRSIFFVGDSYVMGYGLNDEETFAWKIQKSHPEFQIYNFGIAGFGTCHVLVKLRSLLSHPTDKLPTDVVYLLNTFHEERNVGSPLSVYKQDDDDIEESKTCAAELTSRGEIQIKNISIKPRWRISSRLRSAALLDEFIRVASFKIKGNTPLLVTQELLKLISQELAAKGIRFNVVLFDVADRASSYKQYLRQNNIKTIDCTEIAKESPDARQPDGHPNADLNTRMADCIIAGLI